MDIRGQCTWKSKHGRQSHQQGWRRRWTINQRKGGREKTLGRPRKQKNIMKGNGRNHERRRSGSRIEEVRRSKKKKNRRQETRHDHEAHIKGRRSQRSIKEKGPIVVSSQLAIPPSPSKEIPGFPDQVGEPFHV